jgi:LysM repeat protein
VEEVEGTRESSAVGGPPGPTADVDSPFQDVEIASPSEPVVCRFLVQVGEDGRTQPAVDRIDPAHACAALGDPVVQSDRQQELVCLVAAHVNCPRYLRGVLLASSPEPPPAQRPPLSPAVVAAGLVLVAALAASIGFLTVRGGLALPVPSGSPPQVAVVATPTASSAGVAASPSVAATQGSSPSLAPSPSPSPPGSSPSLVVAPRSAPPTALPSSDRYAVLRPCPDAPSCWIYTVRAGDNLQSITNWFGVKYATVLAMNPWIDDPSTIHAGDELRLPPPTR